MCFQKRWESKFTYHHSCVTSIQPQPGMTECEQSGSKIDNRAMCDAIWHFELNETETSERAFTSLQAY